MRAIFTMRHSLRLASSALLIAMAHASFANPPGFVQLPDDPGYAQTEAHAINNAGDIVGGAQLYGPGIGGPVTSFLYSGGAYHNFNVPFSTEQVSTAFGVNNLDQIVGGYDFGRAYEGTVGSVQNLDPPGIIYANALGINDAGVVVGNYYLGYPGLSASHGYVQTGGNYAILDIAGADATVVTGINNNGQVCGYSTTGSSITGFLATTAGAVLATIPGAAPQGLNDYGQVVGYIGSSAFVWTAGMITTISVDGATGASLGGINNSGRMAGSFSTSSTQHGFLADAPPAVKTPTANDLSTNVLALKSVTNLINGSDPNSPPLQLTYTITAGPANGALQVAGTTISIPFTFPGTFPSGAGPVNLTYKSTNINSRADSYQFVVSNGFLASPPATVFITVLVGPPTASGESVAIPEDTATHLSLIASDPNGLKLTCQITEDPTHGALSGAPSSSVIYTPDKSYIGPDSFQFHASDGLLTSDGATVALTVVPAGSNLIASASAPPGQAATTVVPPVSGKSGVTALLNNASGSQTATVTAKSYSGNPESGSFGGLGTTFIDLNVTTVSVNDLMLVKFYYPSTISPPDLLYFTGGHWEPVISSKGLAPQVNPTANLDGTVSGGRITVTFDGTSQPTLAQLTGTVFALTTPGPPTPGAVSLGALENQSVSVPAAKILADASSPNEGALSISDVSPSSMESGTVALSADFVVYTPSPGYCGPDQFTYTLSDGVETAQGTVLISVSPSDQLSQNELSIATSASCAVVSFLGIPGVIYVIQSTDSLANPSWTDLSPELTAGLTGLVTYTDCTSPLPPNRYYRTRVGP